MAKQSGLFLMVVAVLLVVVAGLSSAFVMMAQSGSSAAIGVLTTNYAHDLAQTGLENGNYQLLQGNCSSSWSTVTTVSGMGEYQYSCSRFTATTTTTSSLNTTATSIPLSSVTNMATFGAVTIDSETIFYNGISGNTLLNARRGQNGTSAATHSSGASASQSLYVIASRGGSPDLDTPNGSVTLTQAALATSSSANGYFAAGANTNNRGVIMYYNGSNWSTVVTTASTGYVFYSIEAGSNYGLAVATNESTDNVIIYAYNGVTWNLVYGPDTNSYFGAVSCDNPSNPTRCWIGGRDFSGSDRAALWRYSGSISTSYRATSNFAIEGLSCVSGECVAVGDNSLYAFLSSSTNPMASPLTKSGGNPFVAVDCPRVDSCLLVTDNGGVFYYNGSTIAPSSPATGWRITTRTLAAVHCPSTGMCMVAGDRGQVFRCSMPVTGTGSCSMEGVPGTRDLYAIHCNSTSDCITLGQSGTIGYRYSGGSWSSLPVTGGTTLYAITGAAGSGSITSVTPVVVLNQ